MCVHPILIKNPNKGAKKEGANLFKDCSSDFIPINCGKCPQCIALKQMYLVQRIMMENLNHYLYFGTLTYNDDSLPFKEVNGRKIYFADLRHVQDMFKRIRRYDLFVRPFSYMVVSEFGTLKHRPHFHFILSIPKYEGDNDFTPLEYERILYDNLLNCWSTNIGSRKEPIYKHNCTLVRKFVNGRLSYNFDLHYLNPVLTDSGVANGAYYCLKYMLKPSDYVISLQRALKLNLDEESFNKIWKVVRPRFTYSKGIGLVTSRSYHTGFTSDVFDPDISDYIRKCISFSRATSNYPLFVVPGSSNVMPLAPFYRKHFMTFSDYHTFYMKSHHNDSEDSVFDMDYIDPIEFEQMMLEHEKRVKMAFNVDSTDLIY